MTTESFVLGMWIGLVMGLIIGGCIWMIFAKKTRTLLVGPAEVVDKYNELLSAVQRNHSGETRHQTALRYIREAESFAKGPWPCVQPNKQT